MTIVLTGLSHKTAPVEVRERLALGKDGAEEALRELVDGRIVQEALIVSTCNRVEVLASVEESRVEEGARRVTEALTGGRAVSEELLSKHTYTRKGRKRLGDLTPEQEHAIEALLISAANKIAHPAMRVMRQSFDAARERETKLEREASSEMSLVVNGGLLAAA